MADIKLASVVAPELKESDYGQNIEKQFKNIDNNFKLVSNRDFVKGDSGESLYIENVEIIKEGEGVGGELYNALNSAITGRFNSEGALKSVNGCNWDDAVTQVSVDDEEVGEDKKTGICVPIIASKDKTTNTVEYICAASPVMLFDNRFNKDAIENVNSSNYEDVVDVTSILNFKKDDDGNWVCELNLSYPRLQYENGSFCWVINNENTIVKSTGIKGDPGESANIWIVRSLEFPDAYDYTQINIADYFVGGEWTNNAPENIKDGDLAVVYCESKAKEYYGFFVSQIKIEGGNNTVVYNSKANIQNINYVKNTTEFFKSLGGSGSRGMFLKFKPGDEYSEESHIFYNDRENLYIKPVGSYDYTGVEDYTGLASINIEYDEMNINSEIINISSTATTNISSENGVSIKSTNDTSIEGGQYVIIDSPNVQIINNERLTVSGETNLSGDLTVSGETNLSGDLTITNGKIDINGITLTRQSDNSLAISGRGVEILGGGLTVEGFTDLGAGLHVSDDLTVGGPTTLNNDLTVGGLTTLNNDLKVTSGNIYIGAGITLIEHNDGELEINAKNVEITGGSLTVKGAPTELKSLTVSGTTELNNLKVSGVTTLNNELKVLGNTEIIGKEVVGIGVLDPSLIVKGNKFTDVPGEPSKYLTAIETYGNINVNSGNININSGNININSGNINVNSGDVVVDGDISASSIFAASSVLFLKTLLTSDDWDYVENNVTINSVTGCLTWPKKPAYMLRLEVPDTNNYIVGIPADVYPPNCIVMIDFNTKTYYLHDQNDLDGFEDNFRMFVFGEETFDQTIDIDGKSKTYKFRKPIGWILPGFAWSNN